MSEGDATMPQLDVIVDNYLAAVDRAAADLPQDQRAELLSDLWAHIAAARTQLDPETEAGVLTILERLGDPESIAAEARQGASGDAGWQRAWPAGADQPPRPSPATGVTLGRGASGRSRTAVWITVLALLIGGLTLVCVVGALFFIAAARGESGVDPVPVPAVPVTAPPSR